MWRGRSIQRSIITRSSPNAALASRFAAAVASSSSSAERTTRIPLPPPPASALTTTGKLCSSPEGTIGTPAAVAASLARCLSPISSIASGGGPIQVSPASITARAKPAFSLRNPYPGWTARAPARRAASSTSSGDR